MKLLLILPEPPIPFGGAASRWYHALLDELATRSVRATVLVCSSGKERDEEASSIHGMSHSLSFFPIIKRTKTQVFLNLLRPFSYPYSTDMKRALYSLPLHEFDVVQFETQFTAWLIDRKIPNARINVLNLYCIDWQKQSSNSFYHRFLRTVVIRAEKRLLRNVTNVSTLTDRLSQTVQQINPAANVTTIPMTLDLSQYPFRGGRAINSSRSPTIGLIGSFNWTPTFSAGRQLVEKVWPEFKRRVPNAKLLLVGRNAKTVFADVANEPNLMVYSDVLDPLPFFSAMDVMIYLPSIGSGMKVKVLEAIAMGTPVITNDEGTEGLPRATADAITVRSIEEAIEKAIVLTSNFPSIDDLRLAREQLFNELQLSKSVDLMLSSLAKRTSLTNT